MNSPTPKPIVVFALHAIALTLLIGFWPTPRNAYPAHFHARANALFERVEPGALRVGAPVERPPDTRLTRERAGRPVWHSQFSVQRIGWWPAAALAALMFATPLSALHRGLALLAGLVLLEAFTLGRIAIEVAYLDLEVARGPGGPVGGPWHLFLRTGSESLTATIPSAAAVFACWMALARPRGRIDPGALLPRARDVPADPPPPTTPD